MSPERKEHKQLALEPTLVNHPPLDAHWVERLWVDEADRRYQAYREGRVASRPAAEVLLQARERLIEWPLI